MRTILFTLITIVIFSFKQNRLVDSNFQTTTNIVGEWTPTYSVNKKYGQKNCLPKDVWKLVFMVDGTYKRVHSLGGSFYSIGKYKYDSKTKTLKLFSGKFMPGAGPLLDITYNVISLDSITLKLNDCYCKQSEADEEATDKCVTTYKRTK